MGDVRRPFSRSTCEEGGAPMSVVGPLESLDRGEGGVRVESVQSMATAQIVEKQLCVCVWVTLQFL